MCMCVKSFCFFVPFLFNFLSLCSVLHYMHVIVHVIGRAGASPPSHATGLYPFHFEFVVILPTFDIYYYTIAKEMLNIHCRHSGII